MQLIVDIMVDHSKVLEQSRQNYGSDNCCKEECSLHVLKSWVVRMYMGEGIPKIFWFRTLQGFVDGEDRHPNSRVPTTVREI